jgi:transcriptional regulator with XRE-family HTH domain
VERGEDLITVRALYRLSRALGVSPVTLLRVARL